MIWYTYRMDHILVLITEKEFAAFQIAESLETALVNQKGFVSYYFLDGNTEWLRKLEKYRQVFKQRLTAARLLENDQSAKEIVDRIATKYLQYITFKDKVLGYYKIGRREQGTQLHQQVRSLFFEILALCENYKQLHVTRVRQEARDSLLRAENLRIIASMAVVASILLGVLLAVIFIRQILVPVTRLLRKTGNNQKFERSKNIVNSLSLTVHGLMTDVDQTHTELKKSQAHLARAKRLAMVGKLAAGMAHSIRNPFTSVKMRLFSLNRTLELTADQYEDFEVISEEIRHIDTIVQNFLEFSRPPKLTMQSISPSMIVDRVIQLLSHRLKSYDVSVSIDRNQNLPEINGDPEQLKEVLVNLIINACEAMKSDGELVIREETITSAAQLMNIAIYLTDNGPGIPEHLQEKIMQPFYTTKDEGTGLGLSIAARIIEEHSGNLTVESTPGKGATFCIILPIKEADSGNDSNR